MTQDFVGKLVAITGFVVILEWMADSLNIKTRPSFLVKNFLFGNGEDIYECDDHASNWKEESLLGTYLVEKNVDITDKCCSQNKNFDLSNILIKN